MGRLTNFAGLMSGRTIYSARNGYVNRCGFMAKDKGIPSELVFGLWFLAMV